jgi:plastin-1
MYVTKSIELKDTPEIMRLAEDGEELKDLTKLTPEVILIRWVNFHLKAANQERRIKNLGKDLSDSVALFYVLNQLDGGKCPLDGIDDADMVSRAQKMITNSLALGVPDVVSAHDISSGNTKVNTLFVAQIFNTKHGLEELTKEEYDAAAFLDDDVEGTKEERAFRIWMNSLEIEDVYVNDMLEECFDGLILARVMDKINPKVIDWKKISKAPKNDFDRNINNNTVV